MADEETPERKTPTTMLDALIEAVGLPEKEESEDAETYGSRVGKNPAAIAALANAFHAATVGDRQTAAAQMQSAMELQADPNPPDSHPRHK